MSKPKWRPTAKQHLEIVEKVIAAWRKDNQELFKEKEQNELLCDKAVKRVTELEDDIKKIGASRDIVADLAADRFDDLDKLEKAHTATKEKLALAEEECAYFRDLLRTMVQEAAQLRHGADKPKVTELPKDSILVGDKTRMWSIPERDLEDAIKAKGWEVKKP